MNALSALLCLLSLSLPLSARATPQVRYANLETTYASGFYEPTRSAVLALTLEDGHAVSLTLTAEGRKLTARVWQTQATRCGDRYYARLSVPDERISTDIRLTDYTNVRCRLWVKNKWHATVKTQEPGGDESRLELEGTPE